MLFTDPYYDVSLAAVVSKDSPIANLTELGKRRVGVLRGSYAATWAEANLEEASFTPFQKLSDLLGAVVIGSIDAAVCDNAQAVYWIRENKLSCKVLATVPTEQRYAIAVKRDNTALCDAINGALAEMTEDGTLASLRQRWLGEQTVQPTG